ncbi:zeaxanthin epoxidase [Marchantia polymorpha subsp. ruderalis]|uniref:Zeaxanthin epoxidase, chloroplastic n=2 Tax=Marchantia polymorpha TaxID=3197 RepID=A0A176VND1_MARPO|nr:hypothetical protein AXG93_2381s1240 [Marchantia polymorpha subsp. ruderalis]PTQ42771.1 hypothetical protein MARPO_0028s0084 [Marchantia polymorpha]BBN00626.1 hypothetical protein Mp_2g00670 [Marchantia polymorpha subsp. ruderalis]|eukprot:PTQ42771.1 hypothetical protein MARPO_0028s0084 [Marchantia polymorpha]
MAARVALSSSRLQCLVGGGHSGKLSDSESLKLARPASSCRCGHVENSLRSDAFVGQRLRSKDGALKLKKVVSSTVRAEAVQEVSTANFSTAADSQASLESSFKYSDQISKLVSGNPTRPLRLIIAGGGIGGLVLALAAKKKGIDVKVFERDLSAIKGEGQYRGPIQLQSNALAALEAVDVDVAEEIMANGCVTGDRINGLVDGLTGAWYCKFDTFTPAVERGLPVTRVISRMTLQQILARAVGEEIIENSCNVVDFEDGDDKVTVVLEDGRRVEGDLLVGADGIRSKVRTKLLGPSEATFSQYTCYTGIADFVPADIETVGYRVFLGNKKYFVSSDVGHGKMQWYAFHNEPAGGVDPPGGRKDRLMDLFGHWCDGVVDLLLATPEEQILRRDIYDRVPIMTWSNGRVTLLGDSAHAMQPNMGQGGCMAIEDSYQLALDLEKAMEGGDKSVDIPDILRRYESQRRMRVAAVHGMAGMAAIMASTYKAYLGEGLGPLSVIQKLRIPHPGRVAGQFFITIGMPVMLSWVLGGNTFALEGRAPRCRLEDKADDNLRKWFSDDDALERATTAEWYLLPAGERMPVGDTTASGKKIIRIVGIDSTKSTVLGCEECKDSDVYAAVVAAPGVSERHARFDFTDGAVFITDLQSKSGTWITNIDGARFQAPPSIPVRIHQGDTIELGTSKEAAFRVKLRKPVQESGQAAPSEAVAA